MTIQGRHSLLPLLGIAALLLACSGNHAGLRKKQPGGIIPALRPLKGQYKILGVAESKISTFNLLGAANVTGTPDFTRALQQLTQSKNGDDAIQISYFLEKEYWLLGTINILHLKATVIRYESNQQSAE